MKQIFITTKKSRQILNNDKKLRNYDQSCNINHNPSWLYIPNNHPLVSCGSGSGKANVLLNLLKRQRPDVDKINLYFKHPFEWKYQLFINEREKLVVEQFKNSKAFKIENENLEKYNLRKTRKKFNDMIWYMEANRKIKSYSYWIVFKRKKTLKKTFYLVIYYNHILKCLKTQA